MHMYAFLWVLASIFIPPKLSDYKYQQIGLKNEYFLSQPFNVNKDARGGGSYHDNHITHLSHLSTLTSHLTIVIGQILKKLFIFWISFSLDIPLHSQY